MKQYLDFMRDAYETGNVKTDRTNTGTVSVFGRQMRFNLQEGFPLLTTKKLHTKAIIHELIWFLSGSTNIEYLQDNGVTIWNEWADENGELGPVYGHQWRSWPGRSTLNFVDPSKGLKGDVMMWTPNIDQITNVINQIKTNPDSRRLIVSAWNVADIDQMKLPPCHAFFQFYTREMALVERLSYAVNNDMVGLYDSRLNGDRTAQIKLVDDLGVPCRYLDCQLYQRSIH